jgi:hypothetical protein
MLLKYVKQGQESMIPNTTSARQPPKTLKVKPQIKKKSQPSVLTRNILPKALVLIPLTPLTIVTKVKKINTIFKPNVLVQYIVSTYLVITPGGTLGGNVDSIHVDQITTSRTHITLPNNQIINPTICTITTFLTKHNNHNVKIPTVPLVLIPPLSTLPPPITTIAITWTCSGFLTNLPFSYSFDEDVDEFSPHIALN